MGKPSPIGAQSLTRTDSFLEEDDIDRFFVSQCTHRAYTWVATSVLVVMLCAILSIV